MLCHIQELLKILISGLETNIFEELELSQHVSEEEWETIKPTKRDRRESIISYIKVKSPFAFTYYKKSTTYLNITTGLYLSDKVERNRRLW